MEKRFDFGVPENDDQLPLFSKIGRGPAGDEYRLELDDNKKDETYITCYKHNSATGVDEEIWKTGNINGGSLQIRDSIIYGDLDNDYMQLKFDRVRPNTDDNWTYTTPYITIKKSSKPSWECVISGETNIPIDREGYNTTTLTATLNPGSETPSYTWKVTSGSSFVTIDGPIDQQSCTFKALPGSMHKHATVQCVIGETDHHRRTAVVAYVSVGEHANALYYDLTEITEVKAYDGSSFTEDVAIGESVPAGTLLRAKVNPSMLDAKNNYKVGYNESNFVYLQNRANPYVNFYMPNSNANLCVVVEPKPVRSVDFLIKDDDPSATYQYKELSIDLGGVKYIKAKISDTATTSGTWSTNRPEIVTIDSTGYPLEKKLTGSSTTEGSIGIFLELANVDATFDSSGAILTPGYQQKTYVKQGYVGERKAKAVYISANRKLVFYFDADDHSSEGKQFFLSTIAEDVDAPWKSYSGQIKEVVFDSTFAAYQPLTMSNWFNDMISLESIDFTNINTASCQYMNNLFLNCYSLTDIVWGEHFDTSNVITMASFFANCSNLKKIYLPKAFNVEKVNDLTRFLYKTSSLKEFMVPFIDNQIPTFKTTSLLSMREMFDGCGLEYLNIPEDFDTRKVGINGAFKGSMVGSFRYCDNLKKLYLPENFIIGTGDPGSTYPACGYAEFAAHNSKLETILIYGTAATNYVKKNPSTVEQRDYGVFHNSPKLSAICDNGEVKTIKEQGGDMRNRECMRVSNLHDTTVQQPWYGGLTPLSRYDEYNDQYAAQAQSDQIKIGQFSTFKNLGTNKYLGATFIGETWRRPMLMQKNRDSKIVVGKGEPKDWYRYIQFYNVDPDVRQPGFLELPKQIATYGVPVSTYHIQYDNPAEHFILIQDEIYPDYFRIVPRRDTDMCLEPDKSSDNYGVWIGVYYYEPGNKRQLWKQEAF